MVLLTFLSYWKGTELHSCLLSNVSTLTMQGRLCDTYNAKSACFEFATLLGKELDLHYLHFGKKEMGS